MNQQHERSLRSPAPVGTDDSWIHGPLLGFDTETTGVDPRRDRLVTAALVARGPLVAGARSQRVRTWMADPGVEIPAAEGGIPCGRTARALAQGRTAP